MPALLPTIHSAVSHFDGFLYTAWFRGEVARPDDEDLEGCACFVIQAQTEQAARLWGDHLSSSFSRRRGTETFLRSHTEAASSGLGTTPVIRAGHHATDAELGW